MPEKNDKAGREPKSIDTLIGAGMRIDGDIVCDGVLRVQGDIAGNVSCSSSADAALIVDSAGSVTGAVVMPRVAVRGRVLGPVQSRHSIEVHQGGSLIGDVVFNKMAVHAGGVVEGQVSPAAEAAREASAAMDGRAPAPSPDSDAGSGGRRGGWTLGVATAAITVVAAAAWIVRQPAVPAVEEPVPQSPASAPATLASPPVAASSSAAPVPPADVAPPAPPPSAPAVAQEGEQPAPAAEGREKIVVVKGINPSRPAGVFLLISNEPSVLYRKSRDDPGHGTRVAVPAGEKASVAISRNELIRVAQGSDVVIFFQGVKVPRDLVESGAWISFAPK